MSSPDSTPNIDHFVAQNSAYTEDFSDGGLAKEPARQTVIVACMDARVDVSALAGIRNGEAHVLRNAGGVVTDDTIRSICLSQRALGTREVLIMHHSKCGLEGLDNDAFLDAVEAEVGSRPTWAVQGFPDAQADVRRSMELLHSSPFVMHKDAIRGFVYNVDTGALEEVSA